MYSYEDSIRAVRLYLKLGKRIRATIRQLGYPTKNSLKSWHREYEQCDDLRTGYVRSRPRYSAEQKKAAVDHYLSYDRCAAATLRALGYSSRGTLAGWIAELCPEIGKRSVGRVAGTMLNAAIETVANSDDQPVVHSDRGAHYRWPGWLSRMRDARLVRSMSRKGCSPDNAACEGFFGRLKTELFYPCDWRATTVEQFIVVVDSYIRWYNAKPIKISLGSLNPLEYRESLRIAA